MIEEKLEKLTAADARARSRSAEELGDLLEYGSISEAEAKEVAATLIDATNKEQSPEAKEALLNTLVILGSKRPGLEAPWERLLPLLGSLDKQCLEHALYALGTSRDLRFAGVLHRYLAATDPSVREEASRALRELTYVK